jgi:hypothetical protein
MLSIKNSEITLCGGLARARFKVKEALNKWGLAILPFIFIMGCNVLILIKMFQMRKVKSVTGRGHRNQVFATFSILTVVTGLLHCVSVIPKTLLYLSRSHTFDYGYGFINEGRVNNYEMFVFWKFFPKSMVLFNNSFNFYVYCLAGRDFRKDLRHVLKCCSTRNNTRVQIV